ncbi:AAA family ATPase [Cryobacterium tagatosivorans]|uniref:AAA family ATPase n=1 Tax=Cryobacterium tagatosivorans TaxID=1259199 RepID=UPI00141AFAE8|nr:AAA family ATPase [Cryobacterium tagatosivorans]
MDRIQIFGFKRLLDASAYVGRKTVALVGPNEAGKSSVLAALRLFDDDSPVSSLSFSRSDRGRLRKGDEDVVVLTFALTSHHEQIIKGIPLIVAPTHYRRHKQVNGDRPYSLSPRPVIAPSVHEEAAESWDQLAIALRKKLLGAAETEPALDLVLAQDLDMAALFFSKGDAPADEVWVRLALRVDELESISSGKKLEKSIAAFRDFFSYARPETNLSDLLGDRLDISSPTFAMFGELERAIASEYNIDASTTEESVALANLLEVAGVSLQTIREHRGDAPYISHLTDEANGRLDAYFSSRWSQERVTVGLDVDGEVLRVFVKDKREGSVGWLNITDRSDGLRMFVALATFLSRQEFNQPPILLIDEAEEHLHLNAQADLVRMLQDLDQIQQVIYTTHSPGCLPADLGNGVRFVEPLKGGTSRIRHDFWSMQDGGHVGFNPLLMVMGAGAAAFSGLRNALIVEGASDMLLLPTLIKVATSQSELSYQVAPGIAVASKHDMSRLDTTASRVAFLVDGDESGREWRTQLVDSGMPKERMKEMPADVALEDFLDREFYFDTLNDFFRVDRDRFVTVGVGATLKSLASSWAIHEGLTMPGPVSVAEQILGNHESGRRKIKLNLARRRWLQSLHTWALGTFEDR